jgi:hypothetical protein
MQRSLQSIRADDIKEIKNLKEELADLSQTESALILSDTLEILGGKIIRRKLGKK